MTAVEVYNLDLDDDLLSHLALPESVRYFQAEKLSIDLIEDEYAQIVFEWAMTHLSEYGKPATPSVLTEEFELELAEPLTAVEDLVDRLRQRWLKNVAQDVAEDMAEVYKNDPAGIPKFMVNEGRRLLDMTETKGERIGTGEIDRALYLYDKRVAKGAGPSLGFPEIDNHTYGQTGVTFILAPPKSYKSWIVLPGVAENVRQGKRVRHYSLELPTAETDARLRCLVSGVPEWKYRRGRFTDAERRAWREASEELDSMGVYEIIKPPPGQRTIEAMVGDAITAGCDVVYIDQLQYVEASNGVSLGEAKPQQYWGPLNRARDLSDEIPITIVHQFNRDVKDSDKMPAMQMAKGSSSIEETATLVMGLWGNKEMRASGIIQYGMVASRHNDLVSWEVQVELTRGCGFEVLGRVEEE